ncbi:Signal recognition particle core component [Tyrophagus putrescentiae]|nr:Signal recognition particle core component [Tyrophagus putrescentiae]
MADPAAALSGLFAELKKLEHNGDFEKALKTANKILDLNKENQKAFHCKVVCLIQLNKFEEALSLLNGSSEEVQLALNFEKAYCEYRLNQVNEALETLKLSDANADFARDELKIQALYRIEDYEQNSGDDYEDERYVNLTAVLAGLSLEKAGDVDDADFLDLSENTYEIVYNKACILIGKGQYEAAVRKLEQAEESCRKFLEEDGANEEEIEAELAIIKAQIVFCQQKLGKSELSLKNYNQILRQKLDDPALLAVCSNNVVVIHKDQNLFDLKKKVKVAMNEAAESKLSSHQRRCIYFNYCLFLANNGQTDACRRELEIFKKKDFAAGTTDAAVLESYLALKEKNVPRAIEVLTEQTASAGSSSSGQLELVLLLAQLQIKAENFGEAAKTLTEKLAPEALYLPAVLSTLYLLHQKEGNQKAIEELLLKAAKWHEAKKSPPATLASLYRETAKYYLNQSLPQQAAKVLEKIVAAQKGGRRDPKVTSMLINAYSQFDAAKAQSLQQELPSIEEILSSVDIDHLETKNWSLGMKYVKKSTKLDTPKEGASGATTSKTKKATDQQKEKEKEKKKKKKKRILPKNYNPNEAPDPERWLPRYERSNYRKKKDKKGVGKGTQGAIGEAPEMKPSPKQVIASPQPGPRQQRPTAQKKKKKTGGRK